MSKQYTHVLEIFPEKSERVMVAANRAENQVTPVRYVLSRWDDGLVIGMAQGNQINLIDFANEKNIGMSYRDSKYALAALRKHADEDAQKTFGQLHSFIEEVDMAKRILSPTMNDVTEIGRVRQ